MMQTCEALTKSNKEKRFDINNFIDNFFQYQPANYILKSTELLAFILKTINWIIKAIK